MKKSQLVADAKERMKFISIYEGLKIQYDFKKEEGLTGDQLKIPRKKEFKEDQDYYDEEEPKQKEEELKFSKLELLQLVNRGMLNHESEEDSDYLYE